MNEYFLSQLVLLLQHRIFIFLPVIYFRLTHAIPYTNIHTFDGMDFM